MQFGVSYFGVRNPQHFQRDLEDIARLGFTSIIFTFSEEDHRFYQGSLTEFVRRTHQQGLKAFVDPWGVCGVFGGEAFSERGAWDLEGQQRRSDGRPLPLLCPNSVEVRTYLQRWITTVAEVLLELPGDRLHVLPHLRRCPACVGGVHADDASAPLIPSITIYLSIPGARLVCHGVACS